MIGAVGSRKTFPENIREREMDGPDSYFMDLSHQFLFPGDFQGKFSWTLTFSFTIVLICSITLCIRTGNMIFRDRGFYWRNRLRPTDPEVGNLGPISTSCCYLSILSSFSHLTSRLSFVICHLRVLMVMLLPIVIRLG